MSLVSHLEFSRAGNKIAVAGFLGIENFRVLLASIHSLIHKQGYEDIVLDLSQCTAAFPGAMLPVCAVCLAEQKLGVKFSLILPNDAKLNKLFLDTNWAYLIDSAQTETLYRGYLQVPATTFVDYEEQGRLVDRVIEAVLKSVPGFAREDLEALEWCFSEITDNVLNHAKSPIGGLVQLSNRSNVRRIEFAVCDLGYGIPKTLRPSHPEIQDDYEALSWAIREGVTRDTDFGQGNGLFGSSELCSGSGGFINIQSGNGSLLKSAVGTHLRNEKIPLAGTLIDGCISYAHPGELAKALKFSVSGSDFLSLRYELDDEVPRIVVREEVDSVGARLAAAPIRNKALNLLGMSKINLIAVDFVGIPFISSSFADEALGKLAAFLGLETFQAKVQILNANQTVISLINRAIQQRLALLVTPG
jgi:anti-sigma regulatory factor (Ser/Thr protein kinase)